GLEPDLIWRTVNGRAEINRTARQMCDGSARDGFTLCKDAPLAALRALIVESRIELPDALPPMSAGIFGYLGYDTVRLIEEIGPPNPDPIGLPDAILVRPTIVVIFDAVKNTITVVTPVRPDKTVPAKSALARAAERLGTVVDDLDRALDKEQATDSGGPLVVEPQSNTTPAEFQRMVLAAKDYIAAGDIFQVVLSQRFEAPFGLPAFALYRAIRRINPAPFLFYLDYEKFSVVGSSPEILVRARGDTVTIRPIAGTRPRGATPHEDKALEAELLADPKECAEHLMLLDLGRNDVGRVAMLKESGANAAPSPGLRAPRVRVTDSFFVERYSQVMHIVSNVEGALAEDRDAIDALAGGFPAGTVSG
ncbi:MAG TPA: chorismate-binding protein, partial [Steroidobacteraceae bacterium]